MALLYLVVVSVVATVRSRLDERSFLHLLLVYPPGVAWVLPLLWLVPTATSGRALMYDTLAACIVIVGLMDLRTGVPRPVARGQLRVATFNVFGGSIDIRKCLFFLRRASPDVVFLQEAWWLYGHGHVKDTRPAIDAAFAGWHRVSSSDAAEMMIISRHPVSDIEERRVANRPCLTCVVHAPAGDVRVVNVHFDPPATRNTLRRSGRPVMEFMLETARLRRAQGDSLSALLAESGLPTIAAGDFNSPPHAYARRVCGRVMLDVFAAVGRGFGYTYPNPLPLWRIDHILVSPDIVPACCVVAPVEGSDHRPILADVTLPET